MLLVLSPALALFYFILCKLLNRTEFWVEGNNLVVQHKPLPWFRNRVISLPEIEEVNMEEELITDKYNRPRTTTYHLIIDIHGKPRSTLFPMFSRMFVDLTNDTRREVVSALQQELRVLTGKRARISSIEMQAQVDQSKQIQESRYKKSLFTVNTLLVICLLVTVFAMSFSYNTTRLAKAVQNWPSVDGVVIKSEVVELHSDDNTTYKPKLTYQYQVGNKTYTNDRLEIVNIGYSFKSDAETLIKAHPVDSKVTVYYDPEEPGESLLDKSYNNTGRFFLYFTLVMDAIALIALVLVRINKRSA